MNLLYTFKKYFRYIDIYIKICIINKMDYKNIWRQSLEMIYFIKIKVEEFMHISYNNGVRK